jgi:polysaccharide export outer membrane protein
MRTTGPVAVAPQDDLDSMAYGQPNGAVPASASDSGSGAVGPVRAAFAAAPRMAASPVAYAEPAAVRRDAPYHLDAGDKLRVVVYGQEGLTNTYAVSAGGSITMPLIGWVPARGRTTAGLAAEIAAKLRAGFIREPSVAVEIETYRPFFILGEVAAPGQYPYVPNMTVESAVAIAGGFSPRARRDSVTLTHTDASGTARYAVPPGSAVSPGDTVLVGERWF